MAVKMKWCPNCQKNLAVNKASPPVFTTYVIPIILIVLGIVLLPLAIIFWPLAVLLVLWGNLGLKQSCMSCGLPAKKMSKARPMPGAHA